MWKVLVGAALLGCLGAGACGAQWEMQDPHVKADLRGIDYVGGGVAWASGSDGTVLRTEDMGFVWQLCTTPPGAEKLDFRGVQAFDNETAIVMSSGKGELSRLYKTTDGCQSWKLVFVNPDGEGFWDAMQAKVSIENGCAGGTRMLSGSIFGDPAIHQSNKWDKTQRPSFYLAPFTMALSCGTDTLQPSAASIFSTAGEAAFAASNSVLLQLGPHVFWMATGTRLIRYETGVSSPSGYSVQSFCESAFPLKHGSGSAGVFSVAVRPGSIEASKPMKIDGFHIGESHCRRADVVAVGGDYTAPDEMQQTAAFTAGTDKFRAADTTPHGYRSAVAYDEKAKAWITVGPNGTDVSTDDGRNWQALRPGPGDAPDADKNWNALSLPFVVGPKGRIGILRQGVLGGDGSEKMASPPVVR